jgi:hypothetical protein
MRRTTLLLLAATALTVAAGCHTGADADDPGMGKAGPTAPGASTASAPPEARQGNPGIATAPGGYRDTPGGTPGGQGGR